MSSLPKRLCVPLSLILHLILWETLPAQDVTSRVHFEASGGLILPTRALSANDLGSTRLSSAPFASVALVLQTPARVWIRIRGATALTEGTVTSIRTGTGSTKSNGPDGRIVAGLGEVLFSPDPRRTVELGIGVGIRRYQFGQDDCAGDPCGGNRSQTAFVVSTTGSAGMRLGGVGVALEVGGLVSGYRGQVMFDTTLGARIRF